MRTNLATAGLLAGLILPTTSWGLPDTSKKRTSEKPAPSTNPKPETTDFLQQELNVLMSTDFAVPVDDIPDDFLEKVRRWARLYQTRDRSEMQTVLVSQRKQFEIVRRQVGSADLPPDLAFITLVESHFKANAISPDDNAGLWQFTRDTARRNGLAVKPGLDERLDPQKSTEAACGYLVRLRRLLGREHSLLLVVAAYNMGPGRLKERMQQVEDPSMRYDFWHLYRTHLLPAVTRTHLARLMAAMLIGRHPRYFGFNVATLDNLETVSSAVAPVNPPAHNF